MTESQAVRLLMKTVFQRLLYSACYFLVEQSYSLLGRTALSYMMHVGRLGNVPEC